MNTSKEEKVGQNSAKRMKAAAKNEEQKVEERKGSDLKKGAQRFVERARSAQKPKAS